MKRISLFLVVLSLCGRADLRAQDAATEERLKKLHGLVQDLQESKETQRKQIENLSKEIQQLREQMAKPQGNYASQEDLRKLAESLKELDEKRDADKKLILKEIEKLGKVTAGSSGRKTAIKNSEPPPDKTGGNEGGAQKGFEHTVASGDTVSTIAQAYKDKGIKVTSEQILKANPGLVAEKLKVGQKIFIPAPEK